MRPTVTFRDGKRRKLSGFRHGCDPVRSSQKSPCQCCSPGLRVSGGFPHPLVLPDARQRSGHERWSLGNVILINRARSTAVQTD